LSDAERIADGQHPVAHTQAVRHAKSDGRQFGGIDLQDSQIGFRIAADDFGRQRAVVRQRNLDLVCALHHMMVGQNVAIGADDHARAQVGNLLRARIESFAEEMPENRIVHERTAGAAHLFLGKNVDHGRDRAFGSFREGIGRNSGSPAYNLANGQTIGPQAWLPAQQIGFEQGQDKQHGQQDSDALGEQQPVFTHNFLQTKGIKELYLSCADIYGRAVLPEKRIN
jgi:hypothetical protein